MVAPTITQRLRDRIEQMEVDATRREAVITALADRAIVAEDALRKISHVQGIAGLLARAALRAHAHTSGRDTSLTDLARVQDPPRVLGISEASTLGVVEVCDPTAIREAIELLTDVGTEEYVNPPTAEAMQRVARELHEGRDWPPVPR